VNKNINQNEILFVYSLLYHFQIHVFITTQY